MQIEGSNRASQKSKPIQVLANRQREKTLMIRKNSDITHRNSRKEIETELRYSFRVLNVPHNTCLVVLPCSILEVVPLMFLDIGANTYSDDHQRVRVQSVKNREIAKTKFRLRTLIQCNVEASRRQRMDVVGRSALLSRNIVLMLKEKSEPDTAISNVRENNSSQTSTDALHVS